MLEEWEGFVKGVGPRGGGAGGVRAEAKATRTTLEEYNNELREAEAEYEKGEYTTHDEFVKRIKNW